MAITSKKYSLAGAASLILVPNSNRLCTVVQNRGTGVATLVASNDGDNAPDMANGITLAVDEKFTYPVPVGNNLWASGAGAGGLVVVTNNQE